MRRAIMSHAEYTWVIRDNSMGKVLFACNELAEFITVVALITPGKSMAEADVKSLRKKMKHKFSREASVESRLIDFANIDINVIPRRVSAPLKGDARKT